MPKHDKNWRQTYTGKRVCPVDVKPEDVNIVDIAHHLAFQNRYGGSLHGYESVAEHATLMSRYVMWYAEQPGTPPRYIEDGWNIPWVRVAKHAHLHDSPEWVLQDIVRPLKLELYFKDPLDETKFITYKELERRIERVVLPVFGLDAAQPPIIGRLDNRITRNEYQQGMLYDPGWLMTRKPLDPNDEELPIKIEFWTPERAEKEFLYTYNKLWGGE